MFEITTPKFGGVQISAKFGGGGGLGAAVQFVETIWQQADMATSSSHSVLHRPRHIPKESFVRTTDSLHKKQET